MKKILIIFAILVPIAIALGVGLAFVTQRGNPLNRATASDNRSNNQGDEIEYESPFLDEGDAVYENEIHSDRVDEDGKIVYVCATASVEARLDVAFYMDDCETMVGQVSVDVPEGTEGEIIEASYGKIDVPSSFIVEITMRDGEENLLCDPYLDVEHTDAYAAFMEETVDDFPEERVINYDDQKDTNFGVLSEDVMILDNREKKSFKIVDLDKKLFRIYPSESVASTENLLLIDEDGSRYFVHAESITKKFRGYQLQGAEDSFIGDFFDVYKLQINQEDADQPTEELTAFWDFPDLPDLPNKIDYKSDPIKFPTFTTDFIYGQYGISINITEEMSFEITVLWKKDFLPDNYYYLSRMGLYSEYSISGSIGASTDYSERHSDSRDLLETMQDNKKASSKEGDKELLFSLPIWGGGIAFPFGGESFGVNYGVYLVSELDGSIEASLSVTGGLSVGNEESILEGWKGIPYYSKHPYLNPEEHTMESSLQAEGAWKVGLKASLEMNLDLFLQGTLEGFGGGRVVGTLDAKSGFLNDSPDSTGAVHACNICIGGTASPYIEGKVNEDMYIIEDLVNKLPKKLQDKLTVGTHWSDGREIPLSFDLFASLENDVASIYGGKATFDLGKCQNMAYKTTFYAYDIDGNHVDVPIEATRSDGMWSAAQGSRKDSVSDGDYAYLYPGSYTASAVIDGTEYTEAFSIQDAETEVSICAASEIIVRVVDSETGEGLEGASISVTSDDSKFRNPEELGGGRYRIICSPGDYKVHVQADDYRPAEQEILDVSGSKEVTIALEPEADYVGLYINHPSDIFSGTSHDLQVYSQDGDMITFDYNAYNLRVAYGTGTLTGQVVDGTVHFSAVLNGGGGASGQVAYYRMKFIDEKTVILSRLDANGNSTGNDITMRKEE